MAPASRRLARGSLPPGATIAGADWLLATIRARYPKLAAALGDIAFEAMLGNFMTHAPAARQLLMTSETELPRYLAESCEYPVWYAELAWLDRAHVHVVHAPRADRLTRRTLTMESRLTLIPAHAIVTLTTTVDELWSTLDDAAEMNGRARARMPRALDWPRMVLIWRTEDALLAERTVDHDETAALRAAARGTSLAELSAGLRGYNPHARALDVVLRWIDDGVLVGR